MIKLQLQSRELTGSKARKLLKNGIVPTVVYDNKTVSTNAQAPVGDIIRLLKGATTATILEIDLDGRTFKALIKQVDLDPVKEDVRHVAFYEIDETKPMLFEIPVVLEGVSPAVKNNLGVLIQPNTSIEVKCIVDKLIPSIVLDISTLSQVGQSITVADVELPEGVKLYRADDKELSLVSITEMQQLLSEETPEADAVDAEAEEGEEETTEGEDTAAAE